MMYIQALPMENTISDPAAPASGPIRHTSQADSNLKCDSAVQRFTVKRPYNWSPATQLGLWPSALGQKYCVLAF